METSKDLLSTQPTASLLNAQSETTLPAADERQEHHLDRLLDLYKDHYSLFIKGAIVYLAASGVIAGYTFGPASHHEQHRYFALVMIAASLMWVAASAISLRWWYDAAHTIDDVCMALGITSYPLRQDRLIIAGLGLVSVGIMCAGIFYYVVT